MFILVESTGTWASTKQGQPALNCVQITITMEAMANRFESHGGLMVGGRGRRAMVAAFAAMQSKLWRAGVADDGGDGEWVNMV